MAKGPETNKKFELLSDDFIKDLKAFVKEPNELDIVRVGELLSEFNSYENLNLDLNKFNSFNELYEYTLTDTEFQRFYIQKIQQRKNDILKAEQDIILFLEKATATIKTFIGENLGTEPADKAIQLAKKIESTLENFEIDDGIKLIEQLNKWKRSNNVKDQTKISNEVVELIIKRKEQRGQNKLEEKELPDEQDKQNIKTSSTESEDANKLASPKLEQEIGAASSEKDALKDLKLSNQIISAQNAGDFATIVKLVPSLTREDLKQLWYINIITMALNRKECDIGRAHIKKLNRSDLQKQWTASYNILCPSQTVEKAVTSVAKLVAPSNDSKGVKGCSHSYVDSAGSTFSFIKFALDYDQIDSAIGLAKNDKKVSSVQVIGTVFTKNGIPVERVGDVLYKYENQKFSNVQNWVPEKINKDEFIADFGKYPKVRCKVIGMD